MISPPYRSASESPSALLPDAVGRRTERTIGRDAGPKLRSLAKRHRRRARRTRGSIRAAACASASASVRRLLVVVERHREERLLLGIVGRQRLGGTGSEGRVVGGAGERI